VIDVSTLHPRRHDPPEGWPPEVFEALTDALAAALVAAVRRDGEACENGERSA
jgi:hypothetical protein